MAEVTKPLVHSIIAFNLDKLDENGDQAYAVLYPENDVNDVQLVPLTIPADLDNLPTFNFTTDNLKLYLEINEAKLRKLERDKFDKTEVTTVATANKVLALDNTGKLQATVANAESLGGKLYTEWATLNDLDDATWELSDVYVHEFLPISNLDNIPAVNYDSATLVEFLETNEALIRKLQRDKLNKSEAVTVATPNKLLYLDADGKLQATALNAENLGNRPAADFAIKANIEKALSELGSSTDDEIAALKQALADATWLLNDTYMTGFKPISDQDLDNLPSINYSTDTLELFAQLVDARIRLLQRDKLNIKDQLVELTDAEIDAIVNLSSTDYANAYNDTK